MTNSSDKSSGIVVTGLTKRYGKSTVAALDDVSLTISPGEVYGFLGPNGAGKSTTIKILMNYLRPSSGKATILGKDVVTDSLDIKKHVGYLAGDIMMYPHMTGEQFLTYMKQLQPLKSDEYLEDLKRRFKVDLHKKLHELSRGNRQKIAIIQAFMHQPEVLILDEPTSGLDPIMQEVFCELIVEARQRNATVFMSSHIISEVQKTCDRVGIIRAGKLVNEINVAEISSHARHSYEITFQDEPPLAELTKLAGLQVQSSEGSKVAVTMDGRLSDLFGVLARHEVANFAAIDSDLEDEFIDLYKSGEAS